MEFVAQVEDPDVEDGNGLKVEWYQGDTWLGRGRTFSVRNLRPGSHEITAVVTDPGDLSSEVTVNIKVTKKGEEPGFAGVTATLAVATASLAWVLGGRRGRR